MSVPTKLAGWPMGQRLYPKKEILLYAGSRVSVRAYHPGQARSCALDFSVSAYRYERRSNAYRESAGGFRTNRGATPGLQSRPELGCMCYKAAHAGCCSGY